MSYIDPDEPICEFCGRNHDNEHEGFISELCEDCEAELEEEIQL